MARAQGMKGKEGEVTGKGKSDCVGPNGPWNLDFI